MKVKSGIKPNEFKIEEVGDGKIAVSFFDNVVSKEKDEVIIFEYDMYKIILNDRENLRQDIEENYDSWLQFAKDNEYEKLAGEVRAKRDKLLNETDWTQVTDTVLNNEKQQEYKNYRQELRDITEQSDFPYTVVFPKNPKESEE